MSILLFKWVINYHITKTHGRVEVYLHLFLTSAIYGDGHENISTDLFPLMRPRNPLKTSLGGPQRRAGFFGKERKK